jgi:glycosyltransferase involved in cell wall biosynthesis
MHLVIDAQALQTAGSRNRGIGRYTRSLVRAMIASGKQHRITLVLNGMLPDAIDEVRADFAGLLPAEGIQVWTASGPVHSLDEANVLRRKLAECTREAFIQSLKPDAVLISSLFEGLAENAIESVGSLSSRTPTASILYDLIPWIFQEHYFSNPVFKSWYLRKLDNLRRADLLLSISNSARQEAIQYIGYPANQATNISTAHDEHFKPRALDPEAIRRLRNVYGLERSFVMYTGGIDHRKNIEGVIRAFAALPTALRRQHQLAVVCAAQTHDRERLLDLARSQGLAPGDLVMTGFVPEDDLVSLYNLCKLFVFPSLHEGFGLPALEAMACGRAVIGSNTSSIPEVIGREDALFNPRDDASISALMTKALMDDGWRQSLEADASERAARFSWDRTARTAWAALENLVDQRKSSQKVTMRVPQRRRPRLAYVSPLPPERSGISDYSAELLPELSRHYEIEVVVAQDRVDDAWVQANCPVRDVAWFRAHARRYDRVLYHFGNSAFHVHMFDLLAEHPGVVVLHDFFLSGIVAHMDVTESKPHSWARALYNSHGYKAAAHRYSAQDTADVVWAYPCNIDVLRQARGVIVHSPNSIRLAQHWYEAQADESWAVIPHLRRPEVHPDGGTARQSLGISPTDFVVCSFGLLGRTKLNHRLLDAWLASPLADQPHCHLVFVGENESGEYGQSLVRAIRGHRGASQIEITGWADTSSFRTWLAAADVGVQLRTLSRGETSGTVLDCMNFGLATIVNAHGSMADLPSDALWMLPDAFDDSALVEALTVLHDQPSRRKALSERARQHIQEQCNPRRCADQYAQTIERFYADDGPLVLNVLEAISADLAEAGPSAWAEAVSATAQNFPPKLRRRQLLVDVSELCQRGSTTPAAGGRSSPSMREQILRAIGTHVGSRAGFSTSPMPGRKMSLSRRGAVMCSLHWTCNPRCYRLRRLGSKECASKVCRSRPWSTTCCRSFLRNTLWRELSPYTSAGSSHWPGSTVQCASRRRWPRNCMAGCKPSVRSAHCPSASAGSIWGRIRRHHLTHRRSCRRRRSMCCLPCRSDPAF